MKQGLPFLRKQSKKLPRPNQLPRVRPAEAKREKDLKRKGGLTCHK